jgi:hypothetical protein
MNNLKGYDENILNCNINSLIELRDCLCKYFDKNPSESPISNNITVWPLYDDHFGRCKDGIYAYNKFYIRWYGHDGTTLIKDLRVATHGNHFIMQHRIKDYKGKMKCCQVLGYYVHKFLNGDNLYNWLMKVKEATENKKPGKEINIMILFGFLE